MQRKHSDWSLPLQEAFLTLFSVIDYQRRSVVYSDAVQRQLTTPSRRYQRNVPFFGRFSPLSSSMTTRDRLCFYLPDPRVHLGGYYNAHYVILSSSLLFSSDNFRGVGFKMTRPREVLEPR
jgi:hypothetical protein